MTTAPRLAAAPTIASCLPPQGWARCKHELLGAFRLPPGVGWLVGRVVRKQSLRRVVEQGFGRHSASDRLALVAHELSALSTLLGDRTYLFGRVPYAVDASAFGVLDQMAARELNPDLTDLLERHANLVRAYRQPERWQNTVCSKKCAACTCGLPRARLLARSLAVLCRSPVTSFHNGCRWHTASASAPASLGGTILQLSSGWIARRQKAVTTRSRQRVAARLHGFRMWCEQRRSEERQQ